MGVSYYFKFPDIYISSIYTHTQCTYESVMFKEKLVFKLYTVVPRQ
jgi:hypothetical protein